MPAYSPTTWMVSGAGVRPAGEARKQAMLPVPITLIQPGATTHQIPLRQPPASLSQPAQAGSEAARQIPAAPKSDGESVVDHFQRVMQRFLQVQESVMLSALSGVPVEAAGPAPEVVFRAALEAPPAAPEPAAAPQDAATPGLATAPEAIGAPAEPVILPAMNREQISAHLLSIVSERTGYPVETLSLEAELEADLGVDSIKRVEVAGAINRVIADHFGESVELELLTGAQNLRAMIDVLDSFAAGRAGGGSHPVGSSGC